MDHSVVDDTIQVNYNMFFYYYQFIHRMVASFSNNLGMRRVSLKEQPSYLAEVSMALARREQLARLRQRMSSTKLLLLEQDPETKPWLNLVRKDSNSRR